MNKKIIISTFLIVFLFAAFNFCKAAWEEPSVDPPGGNVSPPLNQGNTGQYKAGALMIGGEDLGLMGGSTFGVVGAGSSSYFAGTIEVGGQLTAQGGVLIQSFNIVIEGVDLNIIDGGTLDIDDGNIELSNGSIILDESIISVTDSTNPIVVYVNSLKDGGIAIKAVTLSGTSVYTSTENGIGVHASIINAGIGVYGIAKDALGIAVAGKAERGGLAGRFDGDVDFNNWPDDDTTTIVSGGNIVVENLLGSTTIDGGDVIIDGDLITVGDSFIVGTLLDVIGDADIAGILTMSGIINMSNNKIINLADPDDPQDAVNLRTLEGQIGGVGGDDDWKFNGDDIYNANSGNVGIGIMKPLFALDVVGDVNIPGKLTVGTIDPIYVIAEERYATYGHSTIGVKEEVLGKINVNKKIAEDLYLYKIDFSEQEKGSDLWLFNEITDFGQDWQDLIVILTPQGRADVWYEIEAEENLLMIYSDQLITVSYRLVAPRFDNQEHPTYLPDSDYEGLRVR